MIISPIAETGHGKRPVQRCVKEELKNYRPLSLLPTLSKLLEKFIKKLNKINVMCYINLKVDSVMVTQRKQH